LPPTHSKAKVRARAPKSFVSFEKARVSRRVLHPTAAIDAALLRMTLTPSLPVLCFQKGRGRRAERPERGALARSRKHVREERDGDGGRVPASAGRLDGGEEARLPRLRARLSQSRLDSSSSYSSSVQFLAVAVLGDDSTVVVPAFQATLVDLLRPGSAAAGH